MMNRRTPVAVTLLLFFLCTASQAQLTFDANSENATGFINNVGFTTTWNTDLLNKNWVNSVPNNVAFTNTSVVTFGVVGGGTGSTTVTVDPSVTNVGNMTIANVASLSYTFNGQRISGLASTLLIDSNSGSTTTFNNSTGGANQFQNFILNQGTVAGSANISVSNNITLNSGSVSAVLAGAGAATKLTAGTATLSGANTYTGGTNVNAGTLALGASNVLADAGAVNIGGGNLSIGTSSDTVGAVTITSGSITGFTGVLTGSSYAVENGSVSAILGGTGALTKTTVGTVTLSGVNTYSGGTNVNAGVLALGASGVLADVGNLTINGGTIDLGSNNETVASVSFISGSITGTGTLTAASFSVQSGTVTANLAGSASVTKTGAGSVTLSGTNTYSGGTTVSQGTLIASSLGTGNVTVSNGATLQTNLSLGAGEVLSGSGTLSGNLVLNGATLNIDPTITTTVDLSKIMNVTGSMSFTNFTLSNITGFDWANAGFGTYRLLSGGTSVTLGAGTSTIANQFNIGGGKFGYFQAGSLDLIITAVPEPSSLALLLVGGLGLTVRRRVRR